MLSGMCSNHFPQSFPTWFSHTRQYRIWVPTINSFAADIGSDIYRQVDINTNDEVENNKKNVAIFFNEDHKKITEYFIGPKVNIFASTHKNTT